MLFENKEREFRQLFNKLPNWMELCLLNHLVTSVKKLIARTSTITVAMIRLFKNFVYIIDLMYNYSVYFYSGKE